MKIKKSTQNNEINENKECMKLQNEKVEKFTVKDEKRKKEN